MHRMPPQPAPADQTLTLLGQARLLWAEFDPAWYLLTYPALRTKLHDPRRRRCSATAWTPSRRSAIRPAVIPMRPGTAPPTRTSPPDSTAARKSGFDHYCRGAYRTHAPHWLFNEQHYRRRNPHPADEAQDGASMADGYEHYLRHGAQEQRAGHLFFDPAFYLAQLDPDAAASAGPFHYYLRRIEASGHDNPHLVYFDPDWYLARYTGVADAIAAGHWRCALHHYLANDTPADFDSLSEFSEATYQARYSDIAVTLQKGALRNGYRHFLSQGPAELRTPAEQIACATTRATPGYAPR